MQEFPLTDRIQFFTFKFVLLPLMTGFVSIFWVKYAFEVMLEGNSHVPDFLAAICFVLSQFFLKWLLVTKQMSLNSQYIKVDDVCIPLMDLRWYYHFPRGNLNGLLIKVKIDSQYRYYFTILPIISSQQVIGRLNDAKKYKNEE